MSVENSRVRVSETVWRLGSEAFREAVQLEAEKGRHIVASLPLLESQAHASTSDSRTK